MSAENKALVRRWFEEVWNKGSVAEMIAERDLVAVRWRCTATHRGEGLGVPATGREVLFTGMGFIRVVDGVLVEGWNNFDQLGMLQQIGVVNLPGS